MTDAGELRKSDAWLMVEARHPLEVRRRDRDWRAKQRAANRPPPSGKVVHPRVLVALPPRVKKGKVTSR